MKPALFFLALIAATGFLIGGEPAKSVVAPLSQAHAHNDYEHRRPLLDALDHGFCGVEADIYLIDGKLLVAHDLKDVKPDRTLQALYLDPLRQRARQNGGRVYPGGPSLLLLIDVKTDADSTYKVLREVLKDYTEMLTVFRPERIETNAVTVIISGNRSHHLIASEKVRPTAIDGRPPDLDGTDSPQLIPLVSDNWSNHFKWRGEGPFPQAEEQKLRQIVQRAHAQRRVLRFWATPDRLEVWRELLKAGVDLINTDDLPSLRDFLSANK